ncbi:MAG: hypothetical protein WC807_09720 [Hyphomicrobium sp.]|jgi:hypothetical protein
MRRLHLSRPLVAALLGLAGMLCLEAPAVAAPDGGYVTAQSRFGNGSITAPVRLARTGYQVRLPRGTWVYCRRSCAETLRVETVDIFEIQGSLTGYGTRLNECGIFGCLELRYPR